MTPNGYASCCVGSGFKLFANGWSPRLSDDIKCLKQADVIYYDKAAGHGIEFDGQDYQVIRLQDVVIVLWES